MNKAKLDSIKQVLVNTQSQILGQPLSLALGDYVIYKGERVNALPYSWKMPEFKDKCVNVSAISSDASKYCIEGWNVFVDRASLTFVRDADPESLATIIAMLEEEGDDDDDDDDEEDWEAEDDDCAKEDTPPSSEAKAAWPFPTDPRDHRSTQKAIADSHDKNSKK